ncbi:MAG: exosortase/archaeosortase family protein [Proteobacteria bacterium]|nr:exosortase/archaeosortase family protein [Pseudomonadota bacterium]
MRTSDWILVALLVAVFVPALLSMAAVWSSLDYYSHGYLVPLVALWAATGQRAVLPTLAVKREPRAFAGLVAALALYLLGLSGSDASLQGLALVLAVASTLYALRGAAWLRALAFPLGFLLFMVPIPPAWLTPLIVKLQLFVSGVGVALVQAMGLPALRQGNVIQLPGGESLFVAEACSGITSIVTLVPLAFFLAYFTERTLGRRAILVAAVIPLAMAGNLIRVVGTVLASDRFGVQAATSGPVHEWAGVLTYVLGCLALLGVGALMQWVSPQRIPMPVQ